MVSRGSSLSSSKPRRHRTSTGKGTAIMCGDERQVDRGYTGSDGVWSADGHVGGCLALLPGQAGRHDSGPPKYPVLTAPVACDME